MFAQLVCRANDAVSRSLVVTSITCRIRSLTNDCSVRPGQTCIHLAGKSGNKKLLEFLLLCGGDINAREGKSGRTLLHWAVVAQKVELVQLILTACKSRNVNAKSYAGRTALDLAWNMFQAVPTNARVRSMIVLLMENGGEPRAPPLSTDTDSELSEDSDEVRCSSLRRYLARSSSLLFAANSEWEFPNFTNNLLFSCEAGKPSAHREG